MDDFTDDDLFLDAVDTIVLDVLQRLGDDPDARFAFFQRLLEVARDVAGESGCEPDLDSWSRQNALIPLGPLRSASDPLQKFVAQESRRSRA